MWGPAQQAAHNGLKEAFNREGTILRRIDYDKPLILHTDFSNRGLGAVLGQVDADGNEYMCACISRSLNKHESNYSSYKGEMLAAVWAAKMFRHHLIGGQPFRLVTDHQPLLYLMSSEGLTGQYARFALVLQEFNFVIEHRPGVKHQNADTLSRQPRSCSVDNSGARLDEEEEAGVIHKSSPCQPSTEDFGAPPACASHNVPYVTQSFNDCSAVHAAMSMARPAAPFSEQFIPSVEKSLAG